MITQHAATEVNGQPRPKSRIFEIPIDLGRPDELLRMVTGWVGSGGPRRVMYVNAHVLNQSQELPELRSALQSADLVYCDGYGVRIAAKALDMPTPHRMTGADWIWSLAGLCEESGQSIYLLGSEPGIAREASNRLQRWYPRLRVAGAHHGFFEIDGGSDPNALDPLASATFTVTPVPEPATALSLIGGLLLAFTVRRRAA